MKTDAANNLRRDMIEKTLATYKERGERKTLSIEYRGVDTALEVIRIHPKYVLLNHDNSRLSAQLMDHPKRSVVEKDPISIEAQEVLASLLRKTERFNKLKDELKELSQQNPGLISRDGLLINGNTRVVALRDLGGEGVDVAVLPADAMARDFLDLEMSLQMRRLTHQDYTFTNELLLIEKYRSAGHSEKELAKKMGWIRGWKKKVDEASQLLLLVKEIRKLSDPPLGFEIFDSKSQHLKDLNEEYNNTAQFDVENANKMKWGRVAAMFLGVNKDQTRVIDADFFEEDVLKRVAKNSKVIQVLDSFKKVQVKDDLDDLLGKSDKAEESLDLRLFAKKVVSDLSDANGNVTKDLTTELLEIHNAIRLGAEAMITKGKRDKLLLEPADVLQETRISLESVLTSFGEVSQLKDFDSKKFEYELSKVKSCISELSTEFDKLKMK
jgi:hypothetical protein